MPRTYWLIDGYNLMHALGLARRKYARGELEKLRERFLGTLSASFNESERANLTVVFDASDPNVDAPRDQNRNGFRVLFAPHDSDADAVIEELLRHHSAPRQVRVVSSDRRLKTAAERRRAQPVSSETFARELDERGTSRNSTSDPATDESLELKGGGAMSDEERAHWLSIFGDAVPATPPKPAVTKPLDDPEAKRKRRPPK